MKVLVPLEVRFQRTPDGACWSPAMAYPFWQRYLAVFDGVRALARVRDCAQAPPDWKRVDGPGVRVAAVPYYVGPAGYLASRGRVIAAVRDALQGRDAVIMRVGSQVAACAEPFLRRARRPFAVEVVGDPHAMFSAGSVRHPLRVFFRWWFTRQLQRQCRDACAAAYVTRAALQRRYPPGPATIAAWYSDVELAGGALAGAPRGYAGRRGPWTLIAVGSLEQLYKGPDLALQALALLLRQGVDARLRWIGGGQQQPVMLALAARLGVAGRVEFVGQLARDRVLAELDRADLFIMPSRQEGLPRALVEAMARALPCVAAAVGGIPELLDADELVPGEDPAALARSIAALLADAPRLERLSARNLACAGGYGEELLRARREEFYRAVRDATAAWIATQPTTSGTAQAGGAG
jgi:glycosyltransferase involved in cell wall biosynthesis